VHCAQSYLNPNTYLGSTFSTWVFEQNWIEDCEILLLELISNFFLKKPVVLMNIHT